MKLYRMQTERLGLNYGYYSISTRKSFDWVPWDCGIEPCPAGSRLIRKFPGVFERFGGPLGDFISGVGPILARRDVAHELASHFRGVEPRPVRIARSWSKRVGSAPAEEVLELWIPLQISATPDRATVNERIDCKECGRIGYRLAGVEGPPSEVEINGRWEMRPGPRRRTREGLQVTWDEMGESHFVQTDGFNLCTEPVRDFIIERAYTNICFYEYGEVVERIDLPSSSNVDAVER